MTEISFAHSPGLNSDLDQIRDVVLFDQAA